MLKLRKCKRYGFIESLLIVFSFEARVAAEFGYISNYAKQRLLQVGRRDNEIDAETLANFIKNSKNLRVEKYRSFASEYEGDDIFKEAVGEVLNVMDEDEEETEGAAPKFPHNMHFYLGMRACDRFFTKFKRYPGQFSNHDEELLANDSAELQAILEDLFKDLGFNTSAIISDVLKEL
jgi:predicted KAP-like P-loop ATPase